LERLKRSEVCFVHKFKKLKCSQLGLFGFKKTNWIEVKRTEAVFLKLLWSPGIDSKELIPPAYALAACTTTLFQLGS
jgi:hypothetical protein